MENEISQYEKMVRQNRADKLALLQALKINELKESFSNYVMDLKAVLRKPRKSRRSIHMGAVRKSLRLQGKKRRDASESKTSAVSGLSRERDSLGRFVKSFGAGPQKKSTLPSTEAKKLTLSFLGVNVTPEILLAEISSTRSGQKFR